MTDVIVTEVETVIESQVVETTIIEVVSEGPPGPPGPAGPQGPPGGVVQYTAINVPNYTVDAAALIEGLNIFGVTYVGGPVIIGVPVSIPPTSVMIIKDETGNAGANNITIQSVQ